MSVYHGKNFLRTKIQKPGGHVGSVKKVKIVPVAQVTSLLPSWDNKHVTSTTVPGLTGNCVVVFIVLVHSVFSPVQSGAVGIIAVC